MSSERSQLMIIITTHLENYQFYIAYCLFVILPYWALLGPIVAQVPPGPGGGVLHDAKVYAPDEASRANIDKYSEISLNTDYVLANIDNNGPFFKRACPNIVK